MNNRDLLSTLALLAALSMVACSGDDGPNVDRDARSLRECAAAGQALTAVWSVGNGHGAITAMSVDGTTVALASADGSIKTWSLTTEIKDEVVGPAAGGIYGGEFEGEAPAFSALGFAEGQRLIAGDTLGSVGLFELNGETVSAMAAGETGIVGVAARPGSLEIALATEAFAGEIGVWNPDTNELFAPMQTILWGVRDLGYSSDGARLVVAGDWYGVPAFELWDSANLESSRVAWVAPMAAGLGGEAAEIVAIALTPDGRHALVGGASPLEPEAGGFLALLDLEYALAAEADGSWVDDGEVIVARTAGAAMAAITDLAIAPDGESYAVASADGSVRLMLAGDELDSGVELPVSARFVAYTDDGARLLTSGDDGELQLWACE
ncbi:MAG TPA: hypothetical protein VML75_14345 [Kofleriaceae bacterium]|nr:hypothetical protein [Kofleriaceae bacterium]